ncbi:TrlF family AAA-like ATPase [Flavobacterium quisquiliarum]|uniref:TrlF family AAA-like ATPase n=1 Tax=Flavobacterium quisquiliarum TaxID=1834436 RepID=A0ABV8W881_9FLAO|nr:hypothetical protein [Flavobacterium quisquiliarum]
MSNRGSEWRKWDLHFHTPSSYDYQDKSITNEKIIEILENNNISVIAITDHHLIDVEKIIDLQNIGKNKNITVLPGIEFRAELGGSESIHYIGIFSEKLNKQELTDIWIKLQSTCKITQTDIQAIGGDANIQCDFKETSKLIHELGGLVSVHAGTKANTFENITNSLPDKIAQKVGLVKGYIDIFELGKEVDQTSYNNIVFPNLGFKLPMIICSDNHKITDYIVKQNLWIKANPTFEGLKQICYEPEQRVKIQNDKPDFKEDKVIINKVKFISSNKVFTDNEIYLNPNLNVIIGGKSSGKSIFLYSIAKTLLVDDTILKNENLEEKYNLKSIDSDFNFEITTNAGISQEMFRNSEENSIIPDIKYIPQNYLVKLAEPDINKKGKSLNKLVRDLINEDQDSKEKYDQFIRNVKQNDKERDDLLNRYFELLEEVAKSESELKTKSNKEVLEKNIKSNTENVEKLNKESGLSDEQILKYKEIQSKLEFNTVRKNNFNDDFANINSGLSDLKKLSNEILEKKKEFVEKIKTENSKQYYINKLSFIDDIYLNISKIFEEIEVQTDETGKRTFKNENLLKNNLISINEERGVLTKELEPYQQNEKLKKQIEILNQSIIDDKKLLADIALLNKAILDKKALIENCRKDIFKLFKENFDEYNNIINELKHRTLELEGDGLKIDGIAQFNFPKFAKNLYEVSDGRKASYNNYTILKETNKATSPTNFNDIIGEIEKIFIDIINGDYFILAKYGKMQAIKELLEDYFFDYWKITYRDDKLGEMSTGKASFVILMLIIGLSKSKAPILIDQPEDNLDNRSITLDLVSYLKNKKLERQIIIVTHNANIVVNSDAENVIIANQKGQNEIDTSSKFKFDLINGSIENTFEKVLKETDILKSMGIREHIADIVEGGKEAFKKREKKYGF